MFQTRYSLAMAATVAAIFTLLSQAISVAEDEQPLIDILQSDVPKAEKAIPCKKLAVWGTAKAVPALAALLPDPELTSWARIALEAIPDPAAGEALREALKKVEGRTLVGVINSIGVRRDAQAVNQLADRLQDADAGVAVAAANALGQIGNGPATAALRQALAESPAAVRSAVAEGCLLCAERLLSGGKNDEAARLYDEVRGADVPKQRLVEAIRGLMLARRADGIPLLVEQLQSGDKDMVAIGLTTARELSGPNVSVQLAEALGDVNADVQALLILALADRGDAQAMPAVLSAVRDGPVEVRVAALEVLKTLGDATCIPVLLGAAAEEDEDIAFAAQRTLAGLPGNDVNADIVARLAEATGQERLILLELVGLRRIDAVTSLLSAVNDADSRVRAAALSALGEVGDMNDVSVLIARVVNPPHVEDRLVALKALQVASIRMPDREACAAKLSSALAQAPPTAKNAILETLAAMGGTNALQTVAAAANSDDVQMQDTATRLLGSWMTVDVGPALLELAQLPDSPYKVRSLRGYIRVARQFVIPDPERADMCRKAWKAAQRDEERQLILEVAQRYPSVGMLRFAVEAAQHPSFKDKGRAVVYSIAEKIGGRGDVPRLLEQIQLEPTAVEIIKATYGVGDKQKDVTGILRSHVRRSPLVALPSDNYNSSFGGDPAPGVPKRLKITYRLDGKSGEVEFAENTTVILPVPK